MAEVDFGELLLEADESIEAQVEFKPLEPGSYDGEIVSAEGKVFSSGNKGIVLQVTPDETNRKIFHNIVFTDNETSREINVRTLRSLGLDIADLRKSAADPASVLVGKRVRMTLIIDEYNGKKNNKIKFFGGIPGHDYSSDTKESAEAVNSGDAPKRPF